MHIAAIDRIDVPKSWSGLPLTLTQTSSRLSAVTLVSVSSLSIAALIMPLAVMSLHATSNPRALAAIVERPVSATVLALGLALAITLLAIPLAAGLSRMRRSRAVRLGGDRITVDDRSLFGGRRHWEAPLSQFTGVTHHIRATLSGPRHEIILVHPDHRKDVLLNLSARAPEHGADQFASLLRLDVIHAGVLYGRRPGRRSAQILPGPVSKTAPASIDRIKRPIAA